MSDTDDLHRSYAPKIAVPEFDSPAFTHLDKPLSACRVAIVTSAALYRSDDKPFASGDTSFRILDRAAFRIDRNVVYPFDRLEELAATKQWFYRATVDR